jgi:hypothetical protein
MARHLIFPVGQSRRKALQINAAKLSHRSGKYLIFQNSGSPLLGTIPFQDIQPDIDKPDHGDGIAGDEIVACFSEQDGLQACPRHAARNLYAMPML